MEREYEQGEASPRLDSYRGESVQVDKLCDVGPHDSVCSVCFSQLGSCLSIGTDRGDVQIWEMESFKKIHTLTGHK